MRNSKVTKMVQMAILIAIIALMAFTPIGFIKTAGLEIQLIMIPVVIGAMLFGPLAGAVCGGAFGILSFIQCFGMSPFGAMLLSINPFLTFMVCIPTRILTGYLTGLLFQWFKKIDKTKTVCYFAGGLVGAVLNTVFFMSVLMLSFGNTDYMKSLNAGNLNVFAFVVAFVGINGLLEWPVTCIAGGAISKAVQKALKL
ncbi:MAG: ECF transporter S component [Lachnospiraceae bacterium]|nr:ECF transporter S component [Lachnospiraceae bacterium]